MSNLRFPFAAAFLTSSLLLALLFLSRSATAQGAVTDCSNDLPLRLALSGGGLVTFDCGAVTIPINGGMYGALTTTGDTTLDGGGKITLDGQKLYRIMFVNAADTLTLTNITLMNGFRGPGAPDDRGAGVFVRGRLVLDNVTFANNHAAFIGGAIYNEGTLTFISSTFRLNGAGYGGAIFSDPTAIVRNSIFETNTVTVNGGAYATNGIVILQNSRFVNNRANGSGGAVIAAATVSATNSSFERNSAPQTNGNGGALWGGSISIITSTLVSNSAGAFGGGAFSSGPLEIMGSAFLSNSAGTIFTDGGGGAHTDADAKIVSSTFSHNNADSGRGGGLNVRHGRLTILDSSFDHNSAKWGGAAAALTATSLSVQNTNFISNVAGGIDGGGIYLELLESVGNVSTSRFIGNRAVDSGGGIYANAGQFQIAETLFLRNRAGSSGGGAFVKILAFINRSTFASNSALGGSAISAGQLTVNASTFTSNDGNYTIYSTDAGPSVLEESTVYANTATWAILAGAKHFKIRDSIVHGPSVSASYCKGTGITQEGRNIIGDTSCGGAPAIGTDPQLLALADNGGSTPTRALPPGSPAIGQAFFCVAGTPDQRGVGRVPPCDIGAYESGTAPTITALAPVSVTAGGAPFTLAIQGSGFITGTVALWNGSPRPTTVVATTLLSVLVNSGDVSAAGTAQVQARYGEAADSVSNALPFTISSQPGGGEPPVSTPGPAPVLLPAVYVAWPVQ